MDIRNISKLIETLAELGFPSSTGKTLLFNTCLHQKSFAIREQMCFGEDIIYYQLYFKEDASKKLICSYYDATLRKAVEIPALVVNGMDVSDLEKRMRAVIWQIPSEDNTGAFDISDKNTWKQEAEIEVITKDLETLGSIAEGADLANMLKYKFWVNPNFQSMIPELISLRSRYELTQRFYLISGDGITTNEAYRFLNNRWTERKIQTSNRLLRQIEIEQRVESQVKRDTSSKKKNRHSPEAKSGK